MCPPTPPHRPTAPPDTPSTSIATPFSHYSGFRPIPEPTVHQAACFTCNARASTERKPGPSNAASPSNRYPCSLVLPWSPSLRADANTRGQGGNIPRSRHIRPLSTSRIRSFYNTKQNQEDFPDLQEFTGQMFYAPAPMSSFPQSLRRRQPSHQQQLFLYLFLLQLRTP